MFRSWFVRTSLLASGGSCVAVLFLWTSVGCAQTLNVERTYKLDDPKIRPVATIDDVAWLAGSWYGEAFGDKFEQVWNPPSAGSMVGMFKLLNGDAVAFYELLLIVEEEGSLSLKVKHFSDTFSAWEDKDDNVTFRLVKLEKEAVHFSGLSFYRQSHDEIHGYLAMRSDGKLLEEKLVYGRR